MAAAADANPAIPFPLAMDYLSRTDTQSQAVGDRRLVDLDPDVISLARLLDSIAAHPRLIARDWWIGQFEEINRRAVAREWDATFGGAVRDYVDPQIVAQI